MASLKALEMDFSKLVSSTLVIVLAVISSLALASDDSNYIDTAQQKLLRTFSGLTIRSFEPGPIEGLYEIDLGSGIAYYHSEKELLFFGEIWDKNGISLTAQSIAKRNIDTISKIPLDQALVLGEKGPEIIEFTDPQCPYCKQFNQWFYREKIDAKRYVFFDTRIHPDAQRSVVHIFCSDDQQQAYKDVFSGKKLKWKTCKKGQKRAEEHLKASIAMGVNGTPSFVLGGALVQGFKKHAIQEYLDRQRLNNTNR